MCSYSSANTALQTGMIRIGAFSSVATHWLPAMIHAFHEDYPNIQYEVLIGDYAEIETWIQEGRVDCGFVHLPTHTRLETTLLEQDLLVAVLPPNHPLTAQATISVADLAQDPFCYWSAAINRKSCLYLKKNTSLPTFALRPGKIMPPWRWWNRDYASQQRRN